MKGRVGFVDIRSSTMDRRVFSCALDGLEAFFHVSLPPATPRDSLVATDLRIKTLFY